MDPKPAYDIEALRDRIPILRRFVPMNNCSQSPQMDFTAEAVEAYLESWRTDGMDWDRWMEEVEAARAGFARLINAPPESISVCTSVSQATSSVASALSFRKGRNKLVVSEGEFPTVGQVWKAQERRGARISWIPTADGVIPLEGYRGAVDSETILVSACHGYYQSGFKQDLSAVVAMAREAGALVYVDAYQTLGTCAFDVEESDVDFLSSGTLKFLMGIPGIAFLYVKPSVAENLRPIVTGWFGRSDPYSLDPKNLTWAPGARRFDTGTPPVVAAYVARAGMGVIEETGLDAIQVWTEVLSEALLEGGSARGLEVLGTRNPRRKTPTTGFLVPGDPHVMEAELRKRGVLASARGPALRLAPHFYSTLDDVEVALNALEAVCSGSADRTSTRQNPNPGFSS